MRDDFQWFDNTDMDMKQQRRIPNLSNTEVICANLMNI